MGVVILLGFKQRTYMPTVSHLINSKFTLHVKTVNENASR